MDLSSAGVAGGVRGGPHVSLLSPMVFIGDGWTVDLSLCDCPVPRARGMGALKIVLENADSSQLNSTELVQYKYQ